MSDKKPEPQPDPERLATGILSLSEGMLERCTREYVLIYATDGGDFGFSCSSRTWGLGAVERARIAMVELERREANKDDA